MTHTTVVKTRREARPVDHETQTDSELVTEALVEETLVAETMVEEVSIDGMCGVY